MNTEPKTIQSLFESYISAQTSLNGEFGGRSDNFETLSWAMEFSKEHGLTLPPDPDLFGLYDACEEDPEFVRDWMTTQGYKPL